MPIRAVFASASPEGGDPRLTAVERSTRGVCWSAPLAPGEHALALAGDVVLVGTAGVCVRVDAFDLATGARLLARELTGTLGTEPVGLGIVPLERALVVVAGDRRRAIVARIDEGTA